MVGLFVFLGGKSICGGKMAANAFYLFRKRLIFKGLTYFINYHKLKPIRF